MEAQQLGVSILCVIICTEKKQQPKKSPENGFG